MRCAMANPRFSFGWCGKGQVKKLNKKIKKIKVLFKEFSHRDIGSLQQDAMQM